MSDRRETYEINPKDIIILGSAYFLIEDVTDPIDPRLEGRTFHVRGWSHKNSAWGRVTPQPATYDKKWLVLDKPTAEQLFPASPPEAAKAIVVKDWKHAKDVEFEGVRFTIASRPGGTPNNICWMSDWGVLRDWVNRGLVREDFIPNSFCDADAVWIGQVA